MSLRKFFGLLMACFLLGGLFGGCITPTDYTVYGILYTDENMNVPMANARLDFTASSYNALGYATTDEEGHFAFFFWDDGNGILQEVSDRKGEEDAETSDEEELLVTQPLTVKLDGKVLFQGNITRDQFTKDNPMRLYPGCNDSETEGGEQ